MVGTGSYLPVCWSSAAPCQVGQTDATQRPGADHNKRVISMAWHVRSGWLSILAPQPTSVASTANSILRPLRHAEGRRLAVPPCFQARQEQVKDPADAASKRLTGRLEKLGIHRPHETTFHSPRHTAKDIMRVAGVDPRTADRQTGHQAEGGRVIGKRQVSTPLRSFGHIAPNAHCSHCCDTGSTSSRWN